MKISHEVPKELFEDSLKFNDYDYALVHLFDKDPEYLQFYKNCVNKKVRSSISDEDYGYAKALEWVLGLPLTIVNKEKK